MARITPKTNWVGADIPVAPDFNRIENNNQQAFDELDAILAGPTVFAGENTFQDGLNVNQILPINTSIGVTVDGVAFRDGAVIGTVWSA